MPSNKPSKNKIFTLIEALSTLTGEDLEEAREILRAAGRDPDQLIKKSIERLQLIQQSVRSRQQPSGEEGGGGPESWLISFDTAGKTLLTEKAGRAQYQVLRADQVYNTFVRKQPLQNIPVAELIFDDSVRRLQFKSALREFLFLICIQIPDASVKPVLNYRQEMVSLQPENIESVLSAGYVILDNTFYAFEKDYLPAAKEFAATLPGFEISLDRAIGLFPKRNTLPFLRFQPEEPDLSPVFTSPALETSLFQQKLYKYQEDGLKWLVYCTVNRLGGILGDDMGLGKTAQIIALIAWCAEHRLFQNILIVVPGTLLENWRREFIFFTPELIPYLHHGRLRTGSALTLQKERIVITSYSILANDVYLLDKIRWGLVILDEASLIRNPEAERTLSSMKLSAEVKIAMTGTPLENSLTDLWSLTNFVRPGYLGTRSEFAAHYIRKDIATTLKEANLARLKKDISYIMLRRRKEDVLDSLPEKTDIHQAIVMGDEEARLYEELRLQMLAGLSETGNHNILQNIQKLRQFTTHPFLTGDRLLQQYPLTELKQASVKLSRTLELLDEICVNKEKVLLFTEYLGMIDLLQTRIKEHYKAPVFVIDGRVSTDIRQTEIDRFSAIEGFSVMVLSPRVAGMGLNITAANHVIHYTRQWNPALEEQATARVYRNGQRKGVNVYYLYYTGTIEETIDERLRAKMALSGEVITTTDTGMTMEEYIGIINKSPIKK